MKVTAIITAIVALLLVASSAAELSKTMLAKNIKQIIGTEPLPDVEFYPLVPGLTTQSPGDTVGSTYYDYQTNGSTGNRVAICEDGSKYFCWMKAFGWPSPPAPRHVYHNWMDANGVLNPNGFDGQVSIDEGAGYTNLDIIYGNRGAIVYHSPGGSSPTYITLAVDDDPPGYAFFDYYDPPDLLSPQTPDNPGRCYWPYVTVDRSNRVHIVMTENTAIEIPQRMAYTRSNDGGPTWISLQLIDTVNVISSVIDASPVSDRVVIAYCRSQDRSTQWRNDIYYVVSEDGVSWDFSNGRVNVTNYGSDDDSLWAYTDCDVIFDYDNYFHIVWNCQWVVSNSVYWKTFLHHYSEETGEITEITHHPDSVFMDICGAWNRPVCKMNLGVQGNSNVIFATWTQFDTSDVSAAGFGNGEIYMTYTSNGTNRKYWEEPTNLTNSPSPGCFQGLCDSDHWSTLADLVDTNLHILFINDKDAGGIPQDEGSATDNPVLYLKYRVTNMITGTVSSGTIPHEGVIVRALQNNQEEGRDTTDLNGCFSIFNLPANTFTVKVIDPTTNDTIFTELAEVCNDRITVLDFQSGIDPEITKPDNFYLSQNYPNPFNVRTKIRYNLPIASNVSLEIYDILGRKIATLIDKKQPAGQHEITWHAGDVVSGTYFYKIKADDYTETRRMVLLK